MQDSGARLLIALLRAASPVLGLIAAVLLASRRRVIREFERRGATNPSAAVRIPPSSFIGAWWLERLERAGVLRTSADGGRWLDHTAWGRYRAVRRRRALVIIAVLFVVIAIAVAIGMK